MATSCPGPLNPVFALKNLEIGCSHFHVFDMTDQRHLKRLAVGWEGQPVNFVTTCIAARRAAVGLRCRARDSFGRVERTARTTRLGRGSRRDYAGPRAFLHDAAVGSGEADFGGFGK